MLNYVPLGASLNCETCRMSLLDVVLWCLLGLLAIGIAAGLSRYRSLGKAQKLLTYVMVVAFASEICSLILRYNGYTNYPIFHVYVIVEYALFVKMYLTQVDKARARIVLNWSPLFLLGFAIVNVILWQPLSVPNTNVTSLYSLIMMAYAIVWFFGVIKTMKYRSLFNSSFFWINAGVLVYFSSLFVLFFLMNQLVNLELIEVEVVLYLNLFFNLVHYLLFNIALWMDPE